MRNLRRRRSAGKWSGRDLPQEGTPRAFVMARWPTVLEGGGGVGPSLSAQVLAVVPGWVLCPQERTLPAPCGLSGQAQNCARGCRRMTLVGEVHCRDLSQCSEVLQGCPSAAWRLWSLWGAGDQGRRGYGV